MARSLPQTAKQLLNQETKLKRNQLMIMTQIKSQIKNPKREMAIKVIKMR
jgi:hypothetical protein